MKAHTAHITNDEQRGMHIFHHILPVHDTHKQLINIVLHAPVSNCDAFVFGDDGDGDGGDWQGAEVWLQNICICLLCMHRRVERELE